MKKLSVNRAEHLLKLFWPEFSEIKGCVFLKSLGYNSRIDVSDPTYAESDGNHTHMLDLFRHDSVGKRRGYKSTHPDFKAAYRIGKKLCVIWAYKLMDDFPNDDFRVYLHGHDPTLRFHKIRKGIPNWLELKHFNPKEVRAGKIMILDTTTMRRRNRSLEARRHPASPLDAGA